MKTKSLKRRLTKAQKKAQKKARKLDRRVELLPDELQSRINGFVSKDWRAIFSKQVLPHMLLCYTGHGLQSLCGLFRAQMGGLPVATSGLANYVYGHETRSLRPSMLPVHSNHGAQEYVDSYRRHYCCEGNHTAEEREIWHHIDESDCFVFSCTRYASTFVRSGRGSSSDFDCDPRLVGRFLCRGCARNYVNYGKKRGFWKDDIGEAVWIARF